MIKRRLILVGENRLSREGLQQILEGDSMTIVASVAQACELIPLLRADAGSADLILICQPDYRDHDWNAIRELTTKFCDVKFAVLASEADFGIYNAAIAAGAHGFLPNSISSAALSLSLQLISLGENLCFTSIADKKAEPAPIVRPSLGNSNDRRVPLSVREWEVLDSLGEGLPNKLIARKLSIAEATVKVHIKAVLRKIEVDNRTQAAVWAMNRKDSMPRVLAREESFCSVA